MSDLRNPAKRFLQKELDLDETMISNENSEKEDYPSNKVKKIGDREKEIRNTRLQRREKVSTAVTDVKRSMLTNSH